MRTTALVLLITLISHVAFAVPAIGAKPQELELPVKDGGVVYSEKLTRARAGDSQAMRDFFRLYQSPLSPFDRTKLTYDLFSIFRRAPVTYTRTADAFFGDQLCAYATLLTEEGENEWYQVEYVLAHVGKAQTREAQTILQRLRGFRALAADKFKVARRACFKAP